MRADSDFRVAKNDPHQKRTVQMIFPTIATLMTGSGGEYFIRVETYAYRVRRAQKDNHQTGKERKKERLPVPARG